MLVNLEVFTLVSTFGQLFTKVLTDRLNVLAEKYHVYIEAQAGFRQHIGAVDDIFWVAWSYYTLTLYITNTLYFCLVRCKTRRITLSILIQYVLERYRGTFHSEWF